MRLLLGMILGALLTVGAAFISDSMTPSASAGGTEFPPHGELGRGG